MGLNSCDFIGRLTRDVEVATVGDNNIKVANFTIAVDRSYKGKNENEPTADFIPVQVWRKKAEFAEKFFGKGKQVYVSGRLETYSYDNKQGQKVYAFRIDASDIGFADTLKGGNGEQSGSDGTYTGNNDDFDLSGFPDMEPGNFENEDLPF